MHIGDQLRAANWQQGDLVENFPGHLWTEQDEEGVFAAKIRIPGASTPGLILSQTCDIVADERKEPYVEIAKVSTSPPDKVELWRRGHPRRFVFDVGERQVADIRYCARLPKEALLKMRRIGSLSPTRRTEFRNWLTARYNRPAVSEELYATVFGPGRAYFASLAARDDAVASVARKLVSVRVGFPTTATSSGVNYSLILCRAESSDAGDAVSLGELAAEFREALPDATMVGWYEVTRSTISHQDWEQTLPLETTALTYSGGEILGPEPSEHIP